MNTYQHNSDFGANNSRNKDPDLRCVEEIPPPFHQIFAKYRNFNVLQSRVFDEVFYTDNPLVVSAPTGSGKTVIFELAITRLLTNAKNNNFDPLFKAVYVAPMKALCEEKMLDWHSRFNEFGISCISVTGDSDIFDCKSLMSHNLIITTPEKWDAITRKWKDNKNFVKTIELFMIDEIHLLNEDTRGPTLEAVVSRMKIIHSYMGAAHKIRFIALSATIPNAEDITEWFDQCSTNPAKCFKFLDETRPVPLRKVVLGYPFNPLHSTPFKFDIMLNYKLQPVMLKYAQGKPVLIFCSTRKSVEMTAKHLMLNITIDLTPHQKQILEEAAITISDTNVRTLLVNGIACHHAGMLPENRRAVENLFRGGHLPILVATSTLAMGVNLPAHLVIVKTTKHYQNGEYRSYSESAILQMIGRAGRPGFDTSAFAVIMTTVEEKEKYENMVGGSQCVESYLHLHLTEHLNSEVVLGTVSDLSVAMEWLTSTFFYVRAKKCPKHYNLPHGLTSDQLDKKLLDMCQIEINKLEKAGMLSIDETTSITPMLLGYLMAKYYLAFDTMKLFKGINGSEILPQMLDLMSNCKEFSDLYLRVNDKKALNLLNKCRNKETIRFPLNGRIKTLAMKINCLIQAVFGCLEVMEHSLQNDAQKIMRIGERISKCLLDYLESLDFIQAHPKAYSALLSANILAKCFHTRLWENSKHVARQLPGIGVTLSGQLVSAGKISFDEILHANPRDLERILGRKPPHGNNMQNLIAQLPKYTLQVFHTKIENGTAIRFNITLKNATEIEEKCTIDKNSYMVLLVGDSFNNIYFYEKFSHDYMIQNGEIEKDFETASLEQHSVFVHFISQIWVGIDCNEKLVLNSKQETNNKTENPAKNKQTKSATNQKQPEEKSKTVQKPKVTVQQFLDVYMKKTKKLNNRTDGGANNETNTTEQETNFVQQAQQNTSSAGDSYNELSESESESLEENYAQFQKNYKKQTVGQEDEDDEKIDGNDEEKIVFDLMDAQYDDIEPLEQENTINTESQKKNDKNSNTEVLDENKKNQVNETHLDHIFEDDEDFNAFCENEQFEPDSTCDVRSNRNTFQLPKIANLQNEQEQNNTKTRKNGDNTQKTITWRSPLITYPAVNYSPAVSFLEKSSESEKDITKNQDYSNENCEIKPTTQDFSIKFLDDSYTPPVTKPITFTQFSQTAPLKKRNCKFELAENPYTQQSQLKHFCAEKPVEKFNSPKIIQKPLQPEGDFHYHSIKVIDSMRQRNTSPLSDISPATLNSSLFRSETADNSFRGGFRKSLQRTSGAENEYRLKTFLDQFKKDEKKKLCTTPKISSSQPVGGGKWNRFLDDLENYEPTPSCSKWNEYLPKEHEEDAYVFKSPPPKRQNTNFFIDSPPQRKKPVVTDFMTEERPFYYTQSHTIPNVDVSTPLRNSQRHYGYSQENRFVNYVPSTKPSPPPSPPPRQYYFEASSQRPYYCLPPQEVVFDKRMMPPQYFSQPAMHCYQPSSQFVTREKHCNCCPRGAPYYNFPSERTQRASCSHYQPDDEHYVEHFRM